MSDGSGFGDGNGGGGGSGDGGGGGVGGGGGGGAGGVCVVCGVCGVCGVCNVRKPQNPKTGGGAHHGSAMESCKVVEIGLKQLLRILILFYVPPTARMHNSGAHWRPRHSLLGDRLFLFGSNHG